MSLAKLLEENTYSREELEGMVDMLVKHLMGLKNKEAEDHVEQEPEVVDDDDCGCTDIEPMSDYEPDEYDDDLEQTIIIKRIANDMPFVTNMREETKNNIIHADDVVVENSLVKFTIGETTYRVPKSQDLVEDGATIPAVTFDAILNGKTHSDITFGVIGTSDTPFVSVGNIPY